MALLRTGSVLDARYEILDRLSNGPAEAEFYRARHVHLDELRAVKLMKVRFLEDELAADRFLDEARMARRIRHPAVATLLDFNRIPGDVFYMAWEFVQGRNLEDCLREGPFPIKLAVDLGIQVLEGLEAIHAAGVVHGDLGPRNLMVAFDRDGRPWIRIIDLGSSHRALALNGFGAGDMSRRLGLWSPEQFGLFDEIDARSDLFTLAAVLYQMVSGRPAFDREHALLGLFEHYRRGPVPLQGRNPEIEVPDALAAVVHRATAFDPARRYRDARTFRWALEEVRDSLPRSMRWRRALRTPMAESTGGLGLLGGRPQSLEGRAEVELRVAEKSRELRLAQARVLFQRHVMVKDPIRAREALAELVELAPDSNDRVECEETVARLEASLQEEPPAVR